MDYISSFKIIPKHKLVTNNILYKYLRILSSTICDKYKKRKDVTYKSLFIIFYNITIIIQKRKINN